MAATEATAQNPAYAMADTTRMTSRNPNFGTSAAATWAAMKTSWKPISAARHLQDGQAQQGCCGEHADGEGGHEQSGVGEGDVEIVGDGGQHPGEHELQGALSENAQPEDVDDERHDPTAP
ncbi:hypothetical protein ACFYRG_38195 [Streptomyces mirabilis]|uniref:hypothetical protein n=1 Tax=Streptomyces mirabilis TaxID=68239 RepID=UPI00368A70D6